MITKMKKVYKEKADKLQKRIDRKLRIKLKKKLAVKKIDDDKYDRQGDDRLYTEIPMLTYKCNHCDYVILRKQKVVD
jgi:rubrerythrin